MMVMFFMFFVLFMLRWFRLFMFVLVRMAAIFEVAAVPVISHVMVKTEVRASSAATAEAAEHHAGE